MSELYEKSKLKLELQAVLDMLASCAGSEEGKKACRMLQPISDAEDVQHLLEETKAAFDLSTMKGYPSFAGIVNIEPAVDRAKQGGILQPKELLEIAKVLRCTAEVKSYIKDEDKETVIDGFFRALIADKVLEARISRSFVSEEEVADAASSELADIRRHMRIQSAKIKEALQLLLSEMGG